MDKQKQIEEMAEVMLSNMEQPKCFTSATEEQKFMNAYKFAFIGYATHLYNAGCRIMNENAVVLTNEEFWALSNKFSKKELDEIVEFHKTKTRKETAEKLLDKVDYESNGQTKQITDLLRKEFGVEKSD